MLLSTIKPQAGLDNEGIKSIAIKQIEEDRRVMPVDDTD